MKAAGIDTNVFTAHTTRSASTSAAKRAGVPMQVILQSAGWSNVTIFKTFYDKDVNVEDSNVTYSDAILDRS